MKKLLLSTQHVKPQERVAYWNDGICSVFASLESKVLSDQPFFGKVEHCQLDFLGMSTVMSSPVQVTRHHDHIAQATQGFYKFSFQVAGEGFLEQDGRCAHLKVGDWSVYDTTRPYVLNLPTDYQQLVIQIPRRCFDLQRSNMQQLTACAFDAQQGLGQIIYQLATSSNQQSEHLVTSNYLTLARSINDLLATSLGNAIPDEQSNDYLPAIKAFIKDNLRDAQLGVESVALHFQRSVRSIHHLFEAENNTISRYIRELRLEKCKQDLLHPQKQQQTITEIAFAWGFNSSTHFGRVFRQAYGVSPKAYRQQCLSLA